MKDDYFLVPLHRNCRDKVRFQWSRNLYKSLCLCFSLGPVLRIFTKILRVPISIIRIAILNITIAIYLDDMLLLGRSIKDVLIATDMVIFLLQHLGFVINLIKSILTPSQKIEFLGLLVDSLNISLSLTPEKLMKVTSQRLEIYKTEKVSILQLTKAHRSFKFNSTSSVTCTTSVSVFATNSGRIAQSRPFISTSSNLEFQCKTGTFLLDPRPETVQWKMSCTTPRTNEDSN